MRMQPRQTRTLVTEFLGWSRMAVPVTSVRYCSFLCLIFSPLTLFVRSSSVREVAKPNVGEFKPARVVLDVIFSLSGMRPQARPEWDALRTHDPVFLLQIEAVMRPGERFDPTRSAQVWMLVADVCCQWLIPVCLCVWLLGATRCACGSWR